MAMTPIEYREALSALGLTQTSAALFLGRDPRMSRKWACGESSIPQELEMLLRLMLHNRISPNEAYQIAFGKPFTRGGDRRLKNS
jgi:hypothetical protein